MYELAYGVAVLKRLFALDMAIKGLQHARTSAISNGSAAIQAEQRRFAWSLGDCLMVTCTRMGEFLKGTSAIVSSLSVIQARGVLRPEASVEDSASDSLSPQTG